MSDYRPPDELVSLAAQMADGGLDEMGREALRQLVDTDRANAAWFVEWMEIHVMLELDLGSQDPATLGQRPLLPTEAPNLNVGGEASRNASSGQSSSFDQVRETTTSRDGPRSKAWLAIAASLLLGISYLLGIATERLDDASSDRIVSVEDSEDVWRSEGIGKGVATITGGTGEELSLGSRLTPGVFRLKAGVAQISFDGGASMVLEGPAELQIVDASNCRLISGALSADVPPEGRAFCIDTADLRVVQDDSAQFGLRTGLGSGTELHTLSGNVGIVDFSNAEVRRRDLRLGEAVRWANGRPIMSVADPAIFSTQLEFARVQRQIEQRSYAEWIDYSRRWSNDPSVLLRYEFGSLVDGVAVNSVNASLHHAKPRNVSPHWVAGRWSGRKAMFFGEYGNVLDTQDHPDLRLKGDLSLAIWLRIRNYTKTGLTRIVGKGYGQDRNFGLWQVHGQLLWQVCAAADPESQEVWNQFDLITDAMPLNQWLLVVGMVDGDESKVYVNGELQAAGEAPTNTATSEDPLTIGFYSKDEFPNHRDFFSGDLDELLLLNRALSEEEVREMYEVGRPKYRLESEEPEIETSASGSSNSVVSIRTI